MSNGPFLCYRELIPPTIIECATFFQSEGSEYLLTVSATTVNIYRIQTSDTSKPVLCHVVQSTLFGKPHDVCAIMLDKNSDATSSHILMMFDEGKVVIFKFDGFRNEIVVEHMINVEENAMGEGALVKCSKKGRSVKGSIPFLAVNMDSSYACCAVYGLQLAFLPISKSIDNGSVFVLDIVEDLHIHGHLVDLCFLEGYSKPTIAILHELEELPIGHAAKRLNTRCLTVMTVHPTSQRCALLWRQVSLPHNSTRIFPIPKYPELLSGGALILSTNAILLVKQEGILGLAMNGFAKVTVGKHIPLQPQPASMVQMKTEKCGDISTEVPTGLAEGVELDGSKWLPVVSHENEDDSSQQSLSLVGSLKDGRIINISLHSPKDMMWCVCSFQAHIVASTLVGTGSRQSIDQSINTCFCQSRSVANHQGNMKAYWFLGSRSNNSLLLEACTLLYVDTVSSASAGSFFFGTPSVQVAASAPSTVKKRRVGMMSSTKDGISKDILVTPTRFPSLAGIGAGDVDGTNVSPQPMAVHTPAYPSTPMQMLPPSAAPTRSIHVSENSADVTAEEEALYDMNLKDAGAICTTNVNIQYHYTVSVVDSLTSLGPVLGSTFASADSTLDQCKTFKWEQFDSSTGDKSDDKINSFSNAPTRLLAHSSTTSAASYIVDREARDALYVCAGSGHGSGLYRLSRGMRLAKLATRDLFGVISVNTLSGAAQQSCFIFLSLPKKTRVIRCEEDPSTANGSSGKIDLFELSSDLCPFVVDDSTLEVGNLAPSIVVQIFPAGIRLVQLAIRRLPENGSTEPAPEDHLALQDVLLEEELDIGGLGGNAGECLVCADTCAGWVLGISDLGRLYVLKYDADEQMLSLQFILQHTSTEENDNVDEEKTDENGCDDTEEFHSLDSFITAPIVTATFYRGSFCYRQHKPAEDCSSAEGAADKIDEQEVEENFLYGKQNRGGSDIDTSMDVENTIVPPVECSSSTYIVICDRDSVVSMIDLDTKQLVFRSADIRDLPDVLIDSSFLCHDKPPDTVPTPVGTNTVIGCRVAAVGYSGGDTTGSSALSNICIVVQLRSQDTVVYRANCSYDIEASFGKKDMKTGAKEKCIVSFSKLDHTIISRRRKGALNATNRLAKSKDALAATPAKGAIIAPITTSMDAITRNMSMYHRHQNLRVVEDLDGHCGLFVSGSRPLFITAERGLPVVMPLSFPELPYSSYGSGYSILPLQVGKVRGAISLWFDDQQLNESALDTISNLSRQGRQSTLELYQDVPDLLTFPGSMVTAKKTPVGCTTHKIIELLAANTDDKTEKALLARKTYVMSCSEVVPIPVCPEVLTEQEKEVDKQNYERFFPNLVSFANADKNTGSTPALYERQYKITLMQHGIVIDMVELPAGEHIMDIDVIYLPTVVEAPANTLLKPTTKKRCFVAVSTSISDKHGEDTQEEGRLLLYLLDYSLFQQHNVTPEADATNDADAENKERNKNLDPVISSLFSSSVSQPLPFVPHVAVSKSSNLSQGAFFDNIQPKLRLLWQGPGPSSIIKQFNDYVIATVGATLYVYRLNSVTMELIQVAFYAMQFFISSISILKNYILVTDACSCIQFLVWREDECSLTLLSKDLDRTVCLTSSFVQDGGVLGMVMGDNEGNLQILRYNPRAFGTGEGFRLVCLADFHLGSDVTTSLSHTMLDTYSRHGLRRVGTGVAVNGKPPPPPAPVIPFGARFDKLKDGRNGKKTCVIIGTSSGSVGVLLPIDEHVYGRLLLLQQLLSITVPTPCGLNPREFRTMKTTSVHHQDGNKIGGGVLDGTLLWKFVCLNSATQRELAAAMGTTVDVILENLQDMDYTSSFF